jgi:UMF1 family MFS transporter
MTFVDVERGRAEGIALARELEELSKAEGEREEVLTEDLINDIQHEQESSYQH